LHFGPFKGFNASSHRNGYVFGGPAEWSAPTDRFDSAAALTSLHAFVDETNGNSIEIPVVSGLGEGGFCC
jgi:hypothetical protein